MAGGGWPCQVAGGEGEGGLRPAVVLVQWEAAEVLQGMKL